MRGDSYFFTVLMVVVVEKDTESTSVTRPRASFVRISYLLLGMPKHAPLTLPEKFSFFWHWPLSVAIMTVLAARDIIIGRVCHFSLDQHGGATHTEASHE